MTRPIDGPTEPGAILGRRTARSFDPSRPLDDATLLELLRMASLAPSPGNLQPWRFVVVRDPGNRRKLRACTFGEARITQAPVVLIVLGYRHPDRQDLARVLDQQRESGLITTDEAARLRVVTPREWKRRGDPARTAMLAVMNLVIAAEVAGIASAILDDFDEEEVRRAIGIPDDHAVCTLIALGFEADRPPFPGRFGLDHLCFPEHFGAPWGLE